MSTHDGTILGMERRIHQLEVDNAGLELRMEMRTTALQQEVAGLETELQKWRRGHTLQAFEEDHRAELLRYRDESDAMEADNAALRAVVGALIAYAHHLSNTIYDKDVSHIAVDSELLRAICLEAVRVGDLLATDSPGKALLEERDALVADNAALLEALDRARRLMEDHANGTGGLGTARDVVEKALATDSPGKDLLEELQAATRDLDARTCQRDVAQQKLAEAEGEMQRLRESNRDLLAFKDEAECSSAEDAVESAMALQELVEAAGQLLHQTAIPNDSPLKKALVAALAKHGGTP